MATDVRGDVSGDLGGEQEHRGGNAYSDKQPVQKYNSQRFRGRSDVILSYVTEQKTCKSWFLGNVYQ